VATDAGAATLTVTAAAPLRPSLVAVMFAVPALTAVTRPAPFTVATAVLLLLHAIVRPVRTLFDASRRVAVACVVWPTVRELAARLTATVATGAGDGGFTVRAVLALRVSLLAVI
jgi:hypothetical protein